MAYSVAVKQGSLTLMQFVKIILSALFLSGLLLACGNKGPLYLPTDTPANGQETTQSTKAERKAAKKDARDDSLIP